MLKPSTPRVAMTAIVPSNAFHAHVACESVSKQATYGQRHSNSETPTFYVDVHNANPHPIHIRFTKDNVTLLLDGKEFHWASATGMTTRVGANKTTALLPFRLSMDQWTTKAGPSNESGHSAGKIADLLPGIHELAITIGIGELTPKQGGPVVWNTGATPFRIDGTNLSINVVTVMGPWGLLCYPPDESVFQSDVPAGGELSFRINLHRYFAKTRCVASRQRLRSQVRQTYREPPLAQASVSVGPAVSSVFDIPDPYAAVDAAEVD